MSRKPVPFYAQTMPGVEEIAWLEIRDKLPQAIYGQTLFAKEQNGILLFTYSGRVDDLFEIRSAEDLFAQALLVEQAPRHRAFLKQLTEMIIKTAAFGQAVDVGMRVRRQSGRPTFRVISRLYGRHPYRRQELQTAVERGIRKRYPHWQQVTDNARLEIWVNMLGSQLLCGVRLSDRTMRHRFKKTVEMKAALRPSVAAAMIQLSQPRPDDVFLDPLCGSGTILMERRLSGPYRRLLGSDLLPENVTASQRNVRGMRKEPPSTFHLFSADAGQLPLVPRSVSKVVTNLPFGRQIGSPQQVDRLYPAFFRELERVLAGNGRAIVLSSEYEQIKNAVRHCPQLVILTGYSVAVLGQWGRIYILERGS